MNKIDNDELLHQLVNSRKKNTQLISELNQSLNLFSSYSISPFDEVNLKDHVDNICMLFNYVFDSDTIKLTYGKNAFNSSITCSLCYEDNSFKLVTSSNDMNSKNIVFSVIENDIYEEECASLHFKKLPGIFDLTKFKFIKKILLVLSLFSLIFLFLSVTLGKIFQNDYFSYLFLFSFFSTILLNRYLLTSVTKKLRLMVYNENISWIKSFLLSLNISKLYFPFIMLLFVPICNSISLDNISNIFWIIFIIVLLLFFVFSLISLFEIIDDEIVSEKFIYKVISIKPIEQSTISMLLRYFLSIVGIIGIMILPIIVLNSFLLWNNEIINDTVMLVSSFILCVVYIFIFINKSIKSLIWKCLPKEEKSVHLDWKK